ncbi:EAL domain-containing protein [Telluria mixta]|uniref:EAL domain-containing protein n=1 Tax=Telluria mixta TaxID=34071 RepID=A0ABT2C3I8_9BURK|nr:EAL domain-containing protein [Telluria mixta]MCS0631896.1 EAL domain-containing protein [Telluria mixta]WEM95420.1 EAL domain-containing protein [Telluria mixta]
MPLHRLLRLTAARRRLTEWLILAAGLVSSGLVLVWMVWTERGEALSEDADRMRAQAVVIDQTLHRQLEGIRWALDGARAALAPNSGCDLACRRTLLQSLKRAMPGVRALLAVGPNGHIEISDDDLGDRRLDDKRFLGQVPHMCDGRTLYLSDPYELQPNQFNLKVAMSLDAGDGCGHGAVTAILNPEYFEAVMRSALYAPDMTITITDLDGHRLLYVPPDPEVMRAGALHPDTMLAAHRASGERVSVRRGTGLDGVDRLVVQRSMRVENLGMDRGLVVALARDAGRINAGWHRLALVSVTAWTLFWSACAAALLLAQRRRAALERLARNAEAERAAAAERVELALNGASLGLWDWHLPSGRRTVDGRACAILGWTRDEQHRQSEDGDIYAPVHPEDRELLRHALDQHLQGAVPAFEAEFRMRHRNGHWVWVQSRGKVVERGTDGKPVRMVGTRTDISARKQAEADIAHLAFYDGLTNLPNRRLLMDRLGHAVAKCERNGGFGAVLFVDLDNFKTLNDTRGHDMGDRLLEMVAFRLQQVTRDADTVARLGGDEFVLLLEDLGTSAVDATAHAELVASKILGTLSFAYTLDGHELRSTPSIGVSLFGNANHVVHDLLRQADMAMYEAKSAGGATFRFFDPSMQAAVDASTSLETDLRFALARREFELYYQPVVNAMGLMVGVEALIRWHHPKQGLTGPGAFIAQAEKSGLIVGIGDWVLQEACRQLARWAIEPATQHFTIAVNVSARQFRQEDFVPRLLEILAHSGADPRRLKLELTESVLLADVEDTIARMTALKAQGIGFSLDDFGTGYSSLSYLQRLPLDQLKIDQSFVRDMLRVPHAASIVQAIVHLAGNLGLHVVAEGVEEEAQWDELRSLGCGGFQGYLFARPMALAELADMTEGEAVPA